MNERRPFSDVLAEREELRERRIKRVQNAGSLEEYHEARLQLGRAEPLQQVANRGFEHLKRRP